MNIFAVMNILLLALLVFTVLLVWSRNWKRKQAYYEHIKSQPENLQWLGRNLRGIAWQDLQTVSKHFGLPLLQAKQLIDFYRRTSR